jgi:hypothetical protein
MLSRQDGKPCMPFSSIWAFLPVQNGKNASCLLAKKPVNFLADGFAVGQKAFITLGTLGVVIHVDTSISIESVLMRSDTKGDFLLNFFGLIPRPLG